MGDLAKKGLQFPKERRGEIWQKNNSCLANKVQQLMAKDRTTSPGRFGKKSNSSQQLVARSSK